jgi:hypothetical protein
MNCDTNHIEALFAQEKLDVLFPQGRSDAFFDALLGDATEGAYDIRLTFGTCQDSKLVFNLELHQRPGKCLACNLTYGLPTVFARHPVIDIPGVVKHIDQMLNGRARCIDWKLGNTRETERGLHTIPLIIDLE